MIGYKLFRKRKDGTYFLPSTVAYLLRRNGFVVDKDSE